MSKAFAKKVGQGQFQARIAGDGCFAVCYEAAVQAICYLCFFEWKTRNAEWCKIQTDDIAAREKRFGLMPGAG